MMVLFEQFGKGIQMEANLRAELLALEMEILLVDGVHIPKRYLVLFLLDDFRTGCHEWSIVGRLHLPQPIDSIADAPVSLLLVQLSQREGVEIA